MPITLDHAAAKRILTEEASKAKTATPDDIEKTWVPLLQTLSDLCPLGKSSTLVAAFAVAALAKSTNAGVNVFCLLERSGKKDDYSARSLADQVWAKNRAALEIDLGANGANPLNNTPFIGKSSIDTIKNVRNKEGWDHFMVCMNALKGVRITTEARSILRAFVRVRTIVKLPPVPIPADAGNHFTASSLTAFIEGYVRSGSDGGRSAQAVAAGLFETIFGASVLDTGRINDPSRHSPLDISVVKKGGTGWILASEVKDKPVTEAELYSSVERAKGEFGVGSVIYVAVGKKQKPIDHAKMETWALSKGVRLLIINSWSQLVTASLIANPENIHIGGVIFRSIAGHLRKLDANSQAQETWAAGAFCR